MQTDKTVTSSEFDRFLAERTAAVASEVAAGGNAAAAAAASATGASSTGAAGATIQRQIDKEEDKSLFAL